ncbi:MAG: hypothetical protein V2B19_20530 [Pseudomonadota bacterium]
MCFRPASAAKKRQVACPKCKKMNPLPLAVESTISEIMENENGKAILEKHCSAMTGDPRFKMAKGMTLKQIKPMSGGKITLEMIELVAKDLAQLPVTKECKFCGEILPIG